MNMHRLRELAMTFPSLASKMEDIGQTFKEGDFDVLRFCKIAAGWSGGAKDAALFILSVWNRSTDWSKNGGLSRDDGPLGGRFDVHRAMGNWDDGNRQAFVQWAADPWWM